MRMRARAESLSLRIVLLILLVLSVGGCGRGGAELTVVVSIPPLESLVEALAGEAAQVVLLVPPSATPHTFSPKPADVRALAKARLFVLVGLKLEHPWAEKLIASAGNLGLKVAYLGKGVEAIGDPPNPHIWLSPREALIMLENLRKALSAVDPAHRDLYARNAAALRERLTALDQEYQALAELPDRRFIAARPAFVYLARDYGLEQVAVIAGTPGQEPTPNRLAELIRLIEAEGIRVLLALAQLEDRFVDLLAEETGIRVVRLDVLGVEHRDYIEMLRSNLEALLAGFTGAGEVSR